MEIKKLTDEMLAAYIYDLRREKDLVRLKLKEAIREQESRAKKKTG